MTEGGGQTTVYGFDDWTYHYMEGIGQNITIEFVDPTGTGEYHITLDPGEKDAMAHVPGGGPSMLEQMGLSTQAARFTRSDGSTAPLGTRRIECGLESQNEFTRLEQFAKVQAPPPVKFKDLEEVVSSRILRNQISFDYRFDFMRITGDTILVPGDGADSEQANDLPRSRRRAIRVAQFVRANQLDDRARDPNV